LKHEFYNLTNILPDSIVYLNFEGYEYYKQNIHTNIIQEVKHTKIIR
jgi:hypothetical protein